MKDFFFLLMGLAIVFGSIFLFLTGPVEQNNEIESVRIGGEVVRVEVVDTPELRGLGLSGRESLEEGTGMLFVFETAGKHGFWMKDMNFAIDIIWIDDAFRITDIAKSVLPDTYPEVFYPKQAIKYVLEVPAGFSETVGIDIGEVVFFGT